MVLLALGEHPVSIDVPNDILWRIAGIISNDIGRGSLRIEHIRHLSQVCHDWRQLILRSPSIWANMIEIDYLASASEDWRMEFMGRTGGAELSVFGMISNSKNKTERNFFLCFLEQYWPRISKFRIEIARMESLPEEMWHIFWSHPAPSLTEFVLSLHVFDTFTLNWQPPRNGSTLFSNTAPNLRVLILPVAKFELGANCLSQLRVIRLPKNYTIQLVLNTLRRCPLMQHLLYHPDPQLYHLTSDEPTIDLPHLNFLDISGTFGQCVDLVTHIKPSPSCILNMFVSLEGRHVEEINKVDISNLGRVLTPYIQSAFMEKRRKHLLLHLSPNLTGFEIDLRTRSWTKKGRTVASIDFDQCSSMAIYKLLLDLLASCNMSSVAALELHIRINDITSDVKTALQQVLSSLTSLQRLYVTGPGMSIISNLSPNRTLSLASLEKITFKYSRQNDQLFEQLREDALSLLLRAAQESASALVLDISDTLRNVGSLIDWRPLDVIKGLKVVWHRPGYNEYMCGSGKPEKLLIKGKDWSNLVYEY